MPENLTQIAFLRGINVGGHHKVPMKELKQVMENMGFTQIRTLLNSGNVIFEANNQPEAVLTQVIGQGLESHFGFPIPTLIRSTAAVASLIAQNPFQSTEVTDQIRLYVSFLNEDTSHDLAIPWVSADGSFRILAVQDRAICSVLDLDQCPTPKAMNMLEKTFGKNLTTRNWNTLLKIGEIAGL